MTLTPVEMLKELNHRDTALTLHRDGDGHWSVTWNKLTNPRITVCIDGNTLDEVIINLYCEAAAVWSNHPQFNPNSEEHNQ